MFGSHALKIYVRIYAPSIENFQNQIQVPPINNGVNKEKSIAFSDFIWETKSTRKGDDETLIYDFSYKFNLPESDWEIIWEKSQF